MKLQLDNFFSLQRPSLRMRFVIGATPKKESNIKKWDHVKKKELQKKKLSGSKSS